MIKSFSSHGLVSFFLDANMMKGIQAKHAKRLADILDVLNAATDSHDVKFPGSQLQNFDIWNAAQRSDGWKSVKKIAA